MVLNYMVHYYGSIVIQANIRLVNIAEHEYISLPKYCITWPEWSIKQTKLIQNYLFLQNKTQNKF